MAGLSRQCTAYGSAACSHLEHAVILCDGKKIHDILPDMRKMIQNIPASLFCYDTVILLRLPGPHDLQEHILRNALAVEIPSRIRA